MRQVRLLFVVWVSILMSDAQAQRPDAGPVDARGDQAVHKLLTQAELDKATAMTSGLQTFLAWFDSWIADAFVFTAADGQVNAGTKNEARRALASGGWTFESVSVDNVGVHVFGETAVVTATQTERSRINGKEMSVRFQYTHVYGQRAGRWQVIAGQVMRLP